jgi:hypothetical protein
MLLFQKRFHEGLVNGAVTVTFRRWDKPHVRVGGRYRCHPIGVLEVDEVEKVVVKNITATDVQRAGFTTRDDLVQYIRTARKEDDLDDDTELYRVVLHHGGDGDRIELALEADLSEEDILTIQTKLEKMDAAPKEPWTKKTLAIIEKHPRIAASQLAVKLGRETAPFKVDVRRLKKLGLTQSFEVGYEISPRGRAYLDAPKPEPKPKPTPTGAKPKAKSSKKKK